MHPTLGTNVLIIVISVVLATPMVTHTGLLIPMVTLPVLGYSSAPLSRKTP